MAPRQPEGEMAPLIDLEGLAHRVRAKRNSKGLSVREAAADIGISAPTLSRVERGLHMPEPENLLRLARWAGIRIDPVLHQGARRIRNADVHEPGVPTIEAVELHLRADKNLSPEDATALNEIFRRAYHALSETSGRSKGKGR